MAKRKPAWFRSLVVLSAVVAAGPLLAVGPDPKRSLADATAQKRPDRSEPAARGTSNDDTEAAALQLVRTHLPELKKVLERLRADDPKQYARAVIDLARSARKLEIAKNRDEQLFEIEVETLQAQNSANLLTAKLKVRDDENDRRRLRRALGRLQQAQLSRAQYEVEALETRLRRTQDQLQSAQQRLETKRDASDSDLEKSYVAYLRRAGRKSESATNQAKKPSNRRRAADSAKPEE